MKEEIGTWPALVGAVVLALLLGGLGLAIYPGWPSLLDKLPSQKEPVDYVAILSAVASFSAVVAAVGIAVHQGGAKRNDDRAKAQLIATHISARLGVVSLQLRDFLSFGSLRHADSETPLLDEFFALKSWFASGYYKPSQEDLLGLVPLPRNASFRIAKAYDVLIFLESQLAAGSRMENYFLYDASESERMAALRTLYDDLKTASDFLTPAVAVCISEAREVTAYPSSAELFGVSK